MARSVWLAAGRSWRPWTTWTSGAYLNHLAEARTAVLQVATSPQGVGTSSSVGAGSAAAAGSCAPSGVGTGAGPASPAQPVTGNSTGCNVPDPSGTGGCVTPALEWLMAQVTARFGRLPVSCWSGRGGDPFSDHPKGRACDYTMGRIGTYPEPDDVRRGWALATWLRANAIALHVNYVIWQGRIWSRVHDAEGWRPYTGGGHYSTTGPTNGHYDHVHVSTTD
jgi:hypothetical protein